MEQRTTERVISPGAEEWLNKEIPCLDHGFVRFVDYMGNDEAIVQAARVSYGKGTKKVQEDRGLIRYLLRHKHTTPFEMVEFKFHMRLPIFVARQLIRHRTANVNEYSGRYSTMSENFYLPHPDVLGKQSKINKQGRGEVLSPEDAAHVLALLKADSENAYMHYTEFLGMDLARELARIGLSVANYTEWYWKIDLHNLFHFLTLRLDSHAQYEIRVFAEAMATIIKDAVPFAYEAFQDYRLNASTFSGPEKEFIKKHHPWLKSEKLVREEIQKKFPSKDEADELVKKLIQLELIAA